MLQFISSSHLSGLAVGLATFLIIGLFHPLVIKSEYYWGTRSWIAFLAAGIAAAAGSIMLKNELLSILAGVVSFSCFWSILEVFEQEKRVEKGWFPANPKRRGPQSPRR